MTGHVFRRTTFIALTGLLLLGLAAINPEPNIAAGLFHSQNASLIKAKSGTTSTTTTSTTTTTTSTATQTSTGNGAPSGPHYDLNIHGVQQGGSASTGSNGHDIFVPLKGKCSIMLSPGAFQVLDPNCLDGSAAFQLPNPVSTTGTTTTSVTTIYSVWVRALAKPGGSSTTTTCAYDLTGTLVCSAGQYVLVETRKNGQSVFTNATSDLLFISQCVNGTLTRTPLFDSTLQNYFWEYDNNGLKLLQLRFYQVPTTVAASGSSC
jgi:hypothetical protein